MVIEVKKVSYQFLYRIGMFGNNIVVPEDIVLKYCFKKNLIPSATCTGWVYKDEKGKETVYFVNCIGPLKPYLRKFIKFPK